MTDPLKVLKVHARLVSGGLMDLDSECGERLLRVLLSPAQEGDERYPAKALIDEIITDDWGPPPTMIVIEVRRENGQRVTIGFPYSNESLASVRGGLPANL